MPNPMNAAMKRIFLLRVMLNETTDGGQIESIGSFVTMLFIAGLRLTI